MKYKLIIPELNSSQLINTLIQHLSEIEGIVCLDQSFGQIIIQSRDPVENLYRLIHQWGFDIQDIIEIPEQIDEKIKDIFFFLPNLLEDDEYEKLCRLCLRNQAIIRLQNSAGFHLLKISYNSEQINENQIQNLLISRHIFSIHLNLNKPRDFFNFLNQRLILSSLFIVPAAATLLYPSVWSRLIMILATVLYMTYPGRNQLMADSYDLRSGKLTYSIARAVALIVSFFSSLLYFIWPINPFMLDWVIMVLVFMDFIRYFTYRIHCGNSPLEPFILFPYSLVCHKKNQQGYQECLSMSLQENDLIKVMHGEPIPADGLIYSGQSSIDYHWFTLDSTPNPVQSTDQVWSGGIVQGDELIIQIQRSPHYSLLNLIILNGYNIHRRSTLRNYGTGLISAGKVAAIWMIYAGFLLIMTYYLSPIRNLSIMSQYIPRIITALLVLDYPLFLSMLKTLLSLHIRAGISRGIILKNPFRNPCAPVDQTLGLGMNYLLNSHSCTIHKIHTAHQWNQNSIVQIAYSLCQFSTDLKSEEIKTVAQQSQVHALSIKNLEMIPAKGRKAELYIPEKENDKIYLGNLSWFREIQLINAELYQKGLSLEREGKEVMAVGVNQHIAGLLVFNSQIFEEAISAVNSLFRQGYNSTLISQEHEKPELTQAVLSRLQSVHGQHSEHPDDDRYITVGIHDDIIDMIKFSCAYHIIFSEIEKINTIPGDAVILSKNRKRLADCIDLTDIILKDIRSVVRTYLTIGGLISLLLSLVLIPVYVPIILVMVCPIVYSWISHRSVNRLLPFAKSD